MLVAVIFRVVGARLRPGRRVTRAGQAGQDDVQPEVDAGGAVVLQFARLQDLPEVGVSLLVGDRSQVGERLLLIRERGGPTGAGKAGNGAQVPVDKERRLEALVRGQAGRAGDRQRVLHPHGVVRRDRHAGDGRIEEPGMAQVALKQPGCPAAQPGLPRLIRAQVRRGPRALSIMSSKSSSRELMCR